MIVPIVSSLILTTHTAMPLHDTVICPSLDFRLSGTLLPVYMWTVHVINLYIHPLSWSVLPPFFLLSLLSPEFIHIVIHFVIYPPRVKVYGNHYNNSNYTNDQLWPAIQGYSQTWHIHANFQEDILNPEQTYIIEKTKFGHGQNLDKNWTSNSVTSPQNLIDKTWTNFWQIFVQYEKTLDKEKYSGQILDKNQNFRTNYGQLFDKT